MPRFIEIPTFAGLFTNADPEDLSPEFMRVLRNLRSVNGKLVKTYGMGERTVALSTAYVYTLATFNHAALTTPDDYKIIAVAFDTGTENQAVFYGLVDGDPDTWANIDTLYTLDGTTYYHDYFKNPVINEPGSIRFLPGNLTGAADTAKGLWLGYIDRDFFDGNYLASTYTAGFYGYPCNVTAPALTMSLSEVSVGDGYASGVPVSYRYSYVFDGAQESLLTASPITHTTTSTGLLKTSFSITKTDHNKRVTALKVYRSTDAATYNHIQTIDFLRPSGEVVSDTAGANPATAKVHIPQLASYTFSAVANYRLMLNARSYLIQEVVEASPYDYFKLSGNVVDEFSGEENVTIEGCTNAGNNDTFSIASVAYESGYTRVYVVGVLTNEAPESIPIDATLFGYSATPIFFNIDNPGAGTGHEVFSFAVGASSLTTDLWGTTWALLEQGDPSILDGDSSGGAYCGINTIILDEDSNTMTPAEYGGGLLLIGGSSAPYAIQDNTSQAVYFSSNVSIYGYSDSAYTLLSAADGMYTCMDDTTAVDYVLYDNNLTAGDEHPLYGEDSIDANGRFARVIGERLWQANIVLDPGDDAEVHDDWVSYSEIGQYDVTPVSNVKQITDRLGGAITGLSELFGNPVVLKKNGIVTIGVRSDPLTPAIWPVVESAHNIGNVAPSGYIDVAGSLYTVWNDGIYRLTPNNLAASDTTPTERLKISDPIEDVYLALTQAQKEAVVSGYDSLKSEIWFRLGDDVYVYNIGTGAWREIGTAIVTNGTTVVFGDDENGNLIAFWSSDKKIYTAVESTAKESVATAVKTKVFAISDERKEPIRYVYLTYKSPTDTLTLTVIEEPEDVPSGNIENGVTYTNTGYTTVTYNGTEYTDGQTFTGIPNLTTYSTTGTGTVSVRKSVTVPASAGWTTHKAYIGMRAKKISVQVTSSASTNNVELGRFRIETA